VERVANDLWQLTNLPRRGGGPLFGVNGNVVVGHGSSKAEGMAGAIDTAARCVELDMVGNMRQELAKLNQQLSSMAPQSGGG